MRIPHRHLLKQHCSPKKCVTISIMIRIDRTLSNLRIHKSFESIIDLTFSNLLDFRIHRSFESIIQLNTSNRSYIFVFVISVFSSSFLQPYVLRKHSWHSNVSYHHPHLPVLERAIKPPPRLESKQSEPCIVRTYFVVRISTPPAPFPHLRAREKPHTRVETTRTRRIVRTYIG